MLQECRPLSKGNNRDCLERRQKARVPTTLGAMTVGRPEVQQWGDILKEMVGYGPDDIPPQALAYAFESCEGPDKSPGALLKSLMQRFEHVVGVGDALRDATTSAKVNGCVSDFAWERHIRPFFEKVRKLLIFENSLTESAQKANSRRERMVPYAQFITWPIGKSTEYPTGRSVLTTMLRPQLSELVRSYCDLAGLLGNLFHHNLEGVATDVRQSVKLVISWIIDATVLGKSKLGNKNRILHHTRGGFKLIVNDHFIEVGSMFVPS